MMELLPSTMSSSSLHLSSRLFPSCKEPHLSSSLASPSSYLLGDRFTASRSPSRSPAARCISAKALLRPAPTPPGAQTHPSPASRSLFSGSSFSCCPPRHPHLRVQSAKKTFSSFDDLLKNSETAVLVDFYATWCGPCQFMVPVLDDVGRTLKDRVSIVKIDSEKYPNIASRYGVQALPTLVLFQDGKPIDRLEGAMTAPDLIKRIEGFLSMSKANARE